MCEKNHKGRFFFSLLALMLVFLLVGESQVVQSQSKYPNRAIDMIIPFSAGGGADLVMRTVAAHLNKKWGVPVNAVNKPGGNTIPACLEVYRSSPDGYTLLCDTLPSATMVGIVVKNPPFKVMERSFVAMMTQVPMVLIVPATSSFKTLQDLVNEAKKDPGNFDWTSSGGTGSNDLIARQFFKAIGVNITGTKPIMGAGGGAGSVVLTAGGQVKLGIGTVSAVLPGISAKTVRPVAITSKTRWPDLADVPTTEEQGYPTINGISWQGISGPPKLPSNIIDQWNKDLGEILKNPEVLPQLKNIGATPFYLSAAEYREYVRKQIEEVDELWGTK